MAKAKAKAKVVAKSATQPAPKLGSGARFKAVEQKVAKKPGVYDPGALAAAIGRRKFGAAKMAKMSATGRKKKKGK